MRTTAATTLCHNGTHWCCPLHLFECSEDLSELVLGDTHARILNGQEDVFAVLADAPGDRDGSGAGELGCRGDARGVGLSSHCC